MKKSSYNIGYILFLAVVAACGGFLFGYDTAVISGTIKQVTTLFGLNDIEQGWYVGCALVGSIAGVAVAGTMSDWIGRRLTMIFASIMFSVSAIGCALCGSYQWLVFYRIVGGIGIGIVSIVSPMYISEIAVTEYRGRLVSLYQLAITVGFLGAYLINYWLLSVSESTRFDSELMNWIFVDEVWRGMLFRSAGYGNFACTLVFHHFVYYTGESALVVVEREGRPIGVYFREDLFSERTGEEAGRGVAGSYSQRDEIGIQVFVSTRNSYSRRCRIMYCDFGSVYGCKCCFVLRAYDI